MENLSVDYNLSMQLKEIGYDEFCWGSWNTTASKDKKPIFVINMMAFKNSNHPMGNACAPLWQEIFDWLRNKHKFMYLIADVKVSAGTTTGYRYDYQAWKLGNDELYLESKTLLGYLTYEEARLECFKHILKYIKENES
jgi:hypothetical protein